MNNTFTTVIFMMLSDDFCILQSYKKLEGGDVNTFLHGQVGFG